MRKLLLATDGAEIAEAALVLPLVFTFILGIVWFGRAFNIYSTITQAAKQGAIVASRPTCATCAGPDPTDTAVDNAVFSVLEASSLDKNQIIQPADPSNRDCPSPAPAHTCTHPNSIVICRNVPLTPTGVTSQCGVIITFQYPFQFHLPFTSLDNQQVVMTAQAQSRMEN